MYIRCVYHRIVWQGCSCTLASGTDFVSLLGLYTQPEARKKGAAKNVLRFVRRWAKANKLPVRLWVGPFADQPMDTTELFKFYSRAGFKYHHTEGRTVFMEYHP